MSDTHCFRCDAAFPVFAKGHCGGTGYGECPTLKEKLCYQCCADREDRHMADTGRATLYIVRHKQGQHEVTDWPGKLRFRPSDVRTHKHGGGFGSQRTDVWFRAHGDLWHGVNMGDNDLLRCRRIKA